MSESFSKYMALVTRGVVFDNYKLSRIAHGSGWTLAHFMAYKGHIFEDKEILMLARPSDGATVAHEIASNGGIFTDKDILKLSRDDGWTVAHVMAVNGYLFTDVEILKLTDWRGLTVAFIINDGRSNIKKVL